MLQLRPGHMTRAMIDNNTTKLNWIPGFLDFRTPGFLDLSIPGYLDQSTPGFLDPSIPGFLDPCILGFVVSWGLQHLSPQTPPHHSFTHPGSQIMHEAIVLNIRWPHPHRAADILEANLTNMKVTLCRHVTHMRKFALHHHNAIHT